MANVLPPGIQTKELRKRCNLERENFLDKILDYMQACYIPPAASLFLGPKRRAEPLHSRRIL